MLRLRPVALYGFGWLFLSVNFLAAAPPSTKPVDGLRQNTPAVHALVNVRLIRAPGQVVEKGNLIIRDGVIVAAGADVAIPSDARIWDLSGKSVYPGLIDAYSEMTLASPTGGAQHWNALITPESAVSGEYKHDSALNDKLRRQGIVARLVAPSAGIVKGESALVTTGSESGDSGILRSNVALHVRLGVSRGRGRESYPNSPMGAVALARQTFLDADWYAKAWGAYQANNSLPRPERNDALEALQKYREGAGLVLFDAANELYFLRADAFAREFSLRAAIRGSGQEYQRLDAIRKTGRAVIVPVNFPRPPSVVGPDAGTDVELDELLHWDLAPENPAMLVRAGVKIALTGAGLRDPNEFLSSVRKAVERGLSADDALRAVTVHPAELLGIENRLGSLENGKAASLIVTDGDLFAGKTKILETWIDGIRFEAERKPGSDVRGQWDVTLDSEANGITSFRLKIAGSPSRLEGSIEIAKADGAKEELKLGKVTQYDSELVASFETKSFGKPGHSQLSATILAKKDQPAELAASIVWPEGTRSLLTATRVADAAPEPDRPKEEPKPGSTEPESKPPSEKPSEGKPDMPATPAPKTEAPKSESPPKDPPPDNPPKQDSPSAEQPKQDPPASPEQPLDEKPESKPDEKPEEAKLNLEKKNPPSSEVPKKLEPKPLDPDEKTKEERKAEETEKQSSAKKPGDKSTSDEKPEVKKGNQPSSFPPNFPLGSFGRKQAPEQPAQILFTNAKVWTCGEQGVIEKASILVGGGKILAVGVDLTPPEGAVVVDLAGKHVSPGIIDCHSHMATDGGVNESTQAITAEVRIGDFIDCNDVNIYRQLAGGVTAANILHGSANAIGGQNQVVKLRWGSLPDEMKFVEAPPGIKFALGENPKQSNWGDSYTSRYPQSRMGVEQLIRDAFQAAEQYRRQKDRWEQSHDSLPPRRDLELDAIVEILEGKRWVHCHSYRQDEILALLRTCEEFQIRIATLQHILEGYKVADAMARHGAMGSAFSDWWAYKFEVYDAIPYAGALMHQAGVVVSFNSDDAELARHLNHEAAKAMKYGNVPPEEALKFVTLNPAKQLRIDALVGSIEKGKHADFVVWSGPPLSVRSRCEQTWIDGRKYFDLQEDAERRAESLKMRAVLIQKILASGESPRAGEESKKPDEELWPREDIFCRRNGNRTAP